ncbi:ABC transporter substrate-binding protein [Afifella sp. IM 167]|uniref:ABC transporter substrate-binding protein n=1 Tax=Afifella sp. IM 167 TaxID=2033586 RepID=UPI001CCCE059|nr:ABC transporter substrate-binding protein [Afifella sp. IM 167]MBZ8131846.1 ABC transporter substrate-binding protein [Afifella sp. IM 167]
MAINGSKPKNGLAGVSRRVFLTGATAALATPYFFTRRAAAAEQVVVRTPGGAYDEIRREVIYGPFEEQTGIRVVPVAATAAKLLAMFKSGHVELDVIDTGDDPLIQLNNLGALRDIPYDEFQFTDPADITPAFKRDYLVGNFIYASVLGYNTDKFASGSEPKSWGDFWNIDNFPGARMLADMATGSPNLEFALIADGVPMDELYPLDIDRAFKSMSKVRPGIKKFWDTGALSAQLLSDGEIDLGSIWHTRISQVIEAGAPLAIQWNQHMMQVQAYSIFKDAQNQEAAVKFVDFCVQPDIQAEFCRRWNAGPVNSKAFDKMPADLLKGIPGSPDLADKGFVLDAEWWAENRPLVSQKWSTWILGG